MNIQEKKGQKLLLMIVIFMVGLSLFSILSYNLMFGGHKLGSQVFRFILTSILCYYMYQGYSWCRKFLVLLIGIGTVFSIFLLKSAFTLIGFTAPSILLLLMFLIYFIIFICLAFSKNIKAYMSYKKAGLDKEEDEDGQVKEL